MVKKIHSIHRDLNERFRQRVEAHYAQVKSFRSKYANTRIIIFALLLLLYVALLYAHRWTALTLPAPLLRSSTLILTILITFTISSIIVRLLEGRIFSIFENEIEIEKRLFYTKLFSFVVYLTAFLMSLYTLGISLGNLTLVAGFITTAFALSMREVIVSYFVWMILLFKRPFRIGDFIRIGDDEGRVAHIGTFYVTIDDGTDARIRMLKVPTRTFLDKTIIGYGEGDVPQDIRIKVQSLPQDIEKQLAELEKVVRGIAAYEAATVTLDVDGEQPVLAVHYEAEFVKRKQVKTKVISAMYEKIGDMRVKPKE